jgi:hypothetical protein
MKSDVLFEITSTKTNYNGLVNALLVHSFSTPLMFICDSVATYLHSDHGRWSSSHMYDGGRTLGYAHRVSQYQSMATPLNVQELWPFKA